MHVEWSDLAREDLDDLVKYIGRDSAFYAQLFGEKVVLATRRLKDFPESGRRIPEADDDSRPSHLVIRHCQNQLKMEFYTGSFLKPL
jgi:plasmid stabilization system protein ParE